MEITHPFVNPKADSADTTIVRPTDWNANHVMTFDASQRVAGRNSAGAGSGEEVTASQILDWVSNTNGVLLTRSGGTWAGFTPTQVLDLVSNANGALLTRTGGTWAAVGNVATDSGDLVFTENASPAAPATGKVKLFGASSGGRQMIAALAPSGAKMALQPLLVSRGITMWVPRADNVVTSLGTGPTTTGTATPRSPTSTSYATGIKRIGYVSAAGAGSVAGARSAAAQYWRGNAANAGGFHVVFRWMISDAVIVTTGRMFVGLQASTAAPTDVDPSSLANIIGVGTDADDTVLQLYAAGAVAQARTSLGANFPANTKNADVYELALYCPPNGSTVTYQVTRLNTGDVASGTISAADSLPSSTTFLTQQMWRTNGATAAAVGIDLISFYAETDL